MVLEKVRRKARGGAGGGSGGDPLLGLTELPPVPEVDGALDTIARALQPQERRDVSALLRQTQRRQESRGCSCFS